MSIVEKLRVTGLIEGVSFLLLLFLAMPLKYMAGYPEAVSVVGMAHGVLFMVYIFFLFLATYKASWSWGRAAFLFGAALVPFGPFLVDKKMREYARLYQIS